MTEGKKKRLLKAGIILVVLFIACLVMAGTGAAELKDISNVDSFTLTYTTGKVTTASEESGFDLGSESSDIPHQVTVTMTNSELKAFFDTDRIWTFETADDINAIAARNASSDNWKHNITYIQVADIDCTGVDMKSIPGWVYHFNMYGNGHSITNYTQSGHDAHGLIEKTGHAENTAVVIDSIVMRNCLIQNSSSGDVAGIVGRNECCLLIMRGCKLENSTVTSRLNDIDTSGGMSSSGEMPIYVGGLVGYSECQLKGEKIMYDFISSIISKKTFIDKFIHLISGDVSDYYKATFLSLEGCSVTQSEIISFYDDDFFTSLFKYDHCYTGGLFGGSSDESYVNIGYCKVQQCKISGYGQYVGGLGGYGKYVTLENVDNFVDNCIIESGYGSAGGLFGCARSISADNVTNLNVVTNTAVLSGDSYGGVIIGDVSYYYKAHIPGSTNNQMHAQNVLVCGKNKGWLGIKGTTHAVSPGYDDKKDDRLVYYLGRGVYYNPDTRISDGTKIDGYTLYSWDGKKLNGYSTQNDIDNDFIKSEFGNGNSTASRVNYGNQVIANIGKYGTEDGYGYFPSKPVTVTFTQTTEYYEFNEPKTKVDERTLVAYTNRRIAEPDPLFIQPDDYSADVYTFSGWFVNEELTDSWNFQEDTVPHPLGINFYSKLTDTKGKWYYDIEYRNGSEVTSETGVECYKPHALKTLDNTEDKIFLGWNTKEDGTGTFYNKGDSISWETEDKLVLYAEWENIPRYTVTFISDNADCGSVSTSSISNVLEGTEITINDDTVTIGSYGSSTAIPASSNYKFTGWSQVSETVAGDMTIVADFAKINKDLIVMNDKITFDTLKEGSQLPDWNAIVILNNTDSAVDVGLDLVKDFNYAYYMGEDSTNITDGLPAVIPANTQMNIFVQPIGVTVGEYQDILTISNSVMSEPVEIIVSFSVITQVEESASVVLPVSPEIYVIDYIQDTSGDDYTLVTFGDNSVFTAESVSGITTDATIKSLDDTANLTVKISNIGNDNYNDHFIYLDNDDIITIEYPEIQTENGSCSMNAEVNAINGALPTISGDEEITTTDMEEAGYTPLFTVISLNTETGTIDKNLKKISMDYKIPQNEIIKEASHLHVLHIDSDGTYDESGVTVTSAEFSEDTNKWEISAESTEGFSSYVVAYYEEIVVNPDTTNPSSTTAFIGEQDGNVFTYERAVVITKAVLPGATRSSVINTNGSGWYTCNIEADGFTGNGMVYFQVPLDVIELKGYTVNDVSFFGGTTTYLGADDKYAKYTSTLDKAGSHTIDFEKDAAQKAVTETKPVTDTQKTQEPAKTVETPVTTEKPVTTETAAKSPVPILGILAGLGIAGVLVMRRK